MQTLDTSGLTVITGAGGFIGGHLVARLVSLGFKRIRCVDIKPQSEWYQVFPGAENIVADLRTDQACAEAMQSADYVFNLACDMGGMGFIENNRAACMLSVLINTHLLDHAHKNGVKRYLYTSSACVYPAYRQETPDVPALKESDAYPALPEDGYGWEKLFSERMCRHAREDWNIDTRIVRLHNVYGPLGTYDGGREKAPAAICRKVIQAKLAGRHEIEIWGDGQQTRSFMYIDDCLQGLSLLMDSPFHDPLNLGSDQLVTINQLVDMVEEIAGIKLERRYNLDAPKGVRGRNSDNTLITEVMRWAPDTRLEKGLEHTYRWIWDQITGAGQARVAFIS